MQEPLSIPMPAALPARKAFHIPSLDGIRAVSFMLVFLAHAGLESKIPGGLGVTVFFFLSGYLITTLLRTEADQNGHISIRDFYIRRALRIFPPFYLIILLGLCLHWTHLLIGPIGGYGVMFQSLHLANYWTVYRLIHNFSLDGIPLGSNVLWSLAVEEHFYLVFPLLFIVLRKWFSARGQTVALTLLCGLILLWRCVLVYYFDVIKVDSAGTLQNARTFFATDTRADSILWGCIFAIACNPMLDKPRVLGFRLLLMVVGALGVLALTLVIRDPESVLPGSHALTLRGFRETFRYTLQGLVLIPIFTAAIIYHESPLFRWLNWKPLRQLGVLSYSLYLVHYTVIYITRRGELDAARGMKGVMQGIIAFGASFGIAMAMYRWVELPCARLRKRFSHASSIKNRVRSGTAEGQVGGEILPLRTAS